MCVHHYIAGSFALCPRGTLMFYGGVNKVRNLYISGSELRRDCIYSSWSIALFCKRNGISYIRATFDAELVLFQSAYLSFFHWPPQLWCGNKRMVSIFISMQMLAFCMWISSFVSSDFFLSISAMGISNATMPYGFRGNFALRPGTLVQPSSPFNFLSSSSQCSQ